MGPYNPVSSPPWMFAVQIELLGRNVPLCMHHLESSHDLRKGNATVLLPVLERLRTLNKDDKGVILAVEDDFGLGAVSAGHLDGLLQWVKRGMQSCERSGMLQISLVRV